jgi:Spy/CpxP family protein refolding chaperone
MKQFNIQTFIVGLLLCLFSQAKAQDNDNPELRDKIRSAEVAYLSQQLNLTPDEAQKFWPIYNNYTREVEQLIAERRRNRQADKQADKKDDAAARQSLNTEMDIEQRMLDVRKRYNQEFLKALPARKAGNVFKAEREFRGQLIRQLKERNAMNRNNRRFNRN